MENRVIDVIMGYVSAVTKSPVPDPQIPALAVHVCVEDVHLVVYQPATAVNEGNVFVELVNRVIETVSHQSVWMTIYMFQQDSIVAQNAR